MAFYAAKGGSSNSNLYTLNAVTGVETSVGAIGFAVTGLAFDPTNGQLYGATSNSSPSHPKALISINKVTGAGTLVGDFGTTGPITDMAFAADGTLYGVEFGVPSLYTINKSTGAPTLVGAIAGVDFFTTITIDAAGNAYSVGNDVWRLNLGTAVATSLGTLAPAVTGTPAAAAISDLDGTAWLVTLNSGTARLYTTDAAGVTSLVASLANNIDGIAWDGDLGTFAPPDVFVLEPMPTGQRVGIAMASLLANEVDVVWTYIDQIPNLVAGIDIRRGRQTEQDQTETSTATVYLNDTDGLFDPDNSSSPYFGSLDGKQIILQCWNPRTAEWVRQYRGVIDDYSFDFSGSVNADGAPLVATVAIECVDAFDYLGGIEMIPGLFGEVPVPAGISAGTVFYEDTDFQTRLQQLAADSDWPLARTQFFTGNVDVQESQYDAGDSVLAAMRDVVDAEFPFLANLFTNKLGDVCAHGRKARFTPETVASGTDWNFTRWKAGDGVAAALDSDRAQIRPPLRWSRARSRIINAALAYPKFPIAGTGGGTFTEDDIPDQIRTDTDSVNAYGYRSWSAPNLLTLAGTTTGNDAKDETALFADYVIANYADPHTRVEALTIKAIDPNDSRAEATWAMLVGQDISDAVDLEHGYPGGVGISESFFIEGSQMTIRPLNPYHDMVEVTLNVSPDAYYATDVFV